jgi:hypothetical protein
MKKNILLLALGLLSSMGIKAQNLVVTLTNASIETFPISSIKSIKFGNSTMILNELNGTVTTWDISDINNYDFSSSVGLNDQMNIENSTLQLFPNPSSNLVNIQFSGVQVGNIVIDIIDLNGKQIQEVYRGAHEGQQTYQWFSSSVKGIYFCRISTNKKVITKPIIIQ